MVLYGENSADGVLADQRCKSGLPGGGRPLPGALTRLIPGIEGGASVHLQVSDGELAIGEIAGGVGPDGLAIGGGAEAVEGGI